MALKHCKGCGKATGKGVKTCVYCGAEQKSIIQQHPTASFIGFIFILSIIVQAFNHNHKTNNINIDEVKDVTPSIEVKLEEVDDKPNIKDVKVKEAFNVGNFTYRVYDYHFSKELGSEYSKVKANGIFLLIGLDIINTDTETHTLDKSLFSLMDNEGRNYEPSNTG